MKICFWTNRFVDMPLGLVSIVVQCCKSWILILALATFSGYPTDQAMAGNGEGIPCLYEGHLNTESNWHGYLANVTVMTQGSMVFEFSYPADKCCQNILFYVEDQMSIIGARMNCWQKEYLLRPEDEQILRLTPRFPWSGCRMTYPNSIATYVCMGGRSFTTTNSDDRPTTWYVAVSNCAALHGLDLSYRLKVYGHIGDCPHLLTTPTPTTTETVPTAKITHVPRTSSSTHMNEEEQNVCIIENTLNVTNQWYGFIANISLGVGGGFRFKFKYPYDMQVQKVILYNDKDIAKLDAKRDCWQKEGIVSNPMIPDQVLDLSSLSSWNGCVEKDTPLGKYLTCQGQRRYTKARNMYMAVCNCRGLNGLYLNYELEVSGFTGDLCSSGNNNPSINSGNLFPSYRTFSSSKSLKVLFSVIVTYLLVFYPSVMLLHVDDSHRQRQYRHHHHHPKFSHKQHQLTARLSECLSNR